MINLTGVCLIRHQINSWEQVQASLIELDKYCDKILVFSYQQRFLSQFSEIKNSKMVVKYLPLSASEEAIEKYLKDCIKLTPTKLVFYLEAGECFHQDNTSSVYIDTLQLLEEPKAIAIDFPMRYIHNQNQFAIDRSLSKRQIRVVKKEFLSEIKIGLGPSILKEKGLFVIPSENELYQYGIQQGREVLGLARFRGEHPLLMKEWLAKKEMEVFQKKNLSPLNSLNYMMVQLERLTGKRMFQPKKYRHLS